MRGRGTWVAGLAVLLVVASGVAGCSGNGSSASRSSVGGGGSSAVMEAPKALPTDSASGAALGTLGTGQASGGHSAATSPALRNTPFGPLIVKTGTLTLELGHDAFDGIVIEANKLATDNGGYVVSSEVQGDKRRSGRIVIRVPAGRFDSTLSDVAGLGNGKVTNRAVSGQDVTPEYIDLNARLTNLQAQEKVLLRLMSEAATVTDTIRVQSQLSDVQGQIEELEGRVRYLRDQASMSTITLTLAQAGAVPAPPSEPNPISQAFRDAGSSALDVVTTVIAGAGLVLPLAILAGIAFLVGRAVWRRVDQPAKPDQEAEASA
jgi:hypothetical protein